MGTYNILVIEDDEIVARTIERSLRGLDFKVTAAASGVEGLRMARMNTPDLVILDVIMKTVLDGLHMSQEMADDPDQRSTPILMVTSIANSDYTALFPTDEYVHIDDFVSKPIAPDDLLRRVARLMKARAA